MGVWGCADFVLISLSDTAFAVVQGARVTGWQIYKSYWFQGMKKKQATEIFKRFSNRTPEPKGELYYTNSFTLLVAVVLSAQATDTGVNKATGPLFGKADTPEKMVRLGEPSVRELVRSIGLYRNKAKNIILLSQKLIDKFDSAVPNTREELETLPGVGRKTANVVLNIAFGLPTIAVDTHLFRVGNRTGLGIGKTPLDVEKALERSIPDEYKLNAHHWLILHGRYVCKARAPDCPNCVIQDVCAYTAKNGPV